MMGSEVVASLTLLRLGGQKLFTFSIESRIHFQTQKASDTRNTRTRAVHRISHSTLHAFTDVKLVYRNPEQMETLCFWACAPVSMNSERRRVLCKARLAPQTQDKYLTPRKLTPPSN